MTWIERRLPSEVISTHHRPMHSELSSPKTVQFFVFSITLAPLVKFIWNLEWPINSLHHGWFLYFQGQKGHIKARWATFWPLFNFFLKNSQRSFLMMLEFVKKSFWKNYPRLPAFKTTFSFGINFLWSYPSELNQIQIMRLFWVKLYLHHKILAFKGQEGPITLLFVTVRK